MKLLIIVINDPDLMVDIAPVLVELDVRNITGIESECIMQFLANEVPIFAGLREILTNPKKYNKTLFGITDDDSVLKNLDETLKSIGIDLTKEGTGFAFTIPIDGIIESPE
jgi:hypothetical protein